jgi:hypothetical protein
MNPAESAEATGLASRVARLLRHDVGDFLQGVYGTLAVLQDRLQETQVVEKRLASDLRRKAELVRAELDAVVQLLTSKEGLTGTVDLVSLARASAAWLSRSFPDGTVTVEAPEHPVWGLAHSGFTESVRALLQALAFDARQIVLRAQASPVPQLGIERQGPSFPREVLGWLEAPFATTNHGHLGLALALTARAISSCGGTCHAEARESLVSLQIRLCPAPEQNEAGS